jgi:cell division protein ZapA
MASVELEIAARKYVVACRDGEEPHLKALAALVDAKAQDATKALGALSEGRHLLFTSLLLADELQERAAGVAQPPAPPPAPAPHPAFDPALLDALDALAARVESLAAKLEDEGRTP